MEILQEDECNDTYGRERMHKALLLKYPDSEIPSETTVYRVMTAIGITHRPNRKPNGITKVVYSGPLRIDERCVSDVTESPNTAPQKYKPPVLEVRLEEKGPKSARSVSGLLQNGQSTGQA